MDTIWWIYLDSKAALSLSMPAKSWVICLDKFIQHKLQTDAGILDKFGSLLFSFCMILSMNLFWRVALMGCGVILPKSTVLIILFEGDGFSVCSYFMRWRISIAKHHDWKLSCSEVYHGLPHDISRSLGWSLKGLPASLNSFWSSNVHLVCVSTSKLLSNRSIVSG